MWGKKGYRGNSTPCTWLSIVALPSWLLCFLPKAFPTAISFCTSPQPISLKSTADLTLGLSSIPKSQLPATVLSRGLMSLSIVYMAMAYCLCDSHSIQSVTDQLLHSPTASNASLSQTAAPMWGSDPCFSFLILQMQVQSCSLSSFSSYFLCPAKFCMVLYIFFWWSGTPAHSQLVFCNIFCVWKYIPDASVERDVLHVHLLLCNHILWS